MLLQRTAAFCPNNKYFACFSYDDKLHVWEISSNIVKIDCKLDSDVYGACMSLHWISLKHNHLSPRKTRQSLHLEDQLLALGTVKGDIILYNITAKNLYSHLVARHSDSVNDMFFHRETDSFFTCSSDKHIAIWDITSGKQKSKWIADDTPVSSICVLDNNNLLSASTSILWWNIKEKSIIKRFDGHSTEIFKLFPINASLSLKSCYFLSAAISDSKINAWSLSSNDCQTPVASFELSGQPEDLDISRSSSKDKPLILSVVTKGGYLNLFEHTLNGNVNQPLHPKITMKINSESNRIEPKDAAVFCTKLSDDSESCTIAYGSSKDSMMFKHIRIKDLLKNSHSENAASYNSFPEDRLFEGNDSSKLEKTQSINGLMSSKSSVNSPKAVRLKDSGSVVNSPRKKAKSSNQRENKSSIRKSNVPVEEPCEEDTQHLQRSSKSYIRDSDIADPDSSVGILLKGLQTHNENLIDIVFHSNDTELICGCVKHLPLHTLKYVLEELNSRLRHHHKSSPMLRKWLKEILRVHLNYLTECPDTVEILGCFKDVLEAKRISETRSKMSAVKSICNLLSTQIQNTSSDESDSESEECMES